MSNCRYCGKEIEFRYIDGQCVPLHMDGSWCDGQVSGDGGRVVNSNVHIKFDDCCRITTCPECGDDVFFIKHNGGSVWVDSLGWPWPKHGCMERNKDPSWYRYFQSKELSKGDERLFAGIIVKSKWVSTEKNKSASIIVAIDGGEQGRTIFMIDGTTTSDYVLNKLAIFNHNTFELILSSSDVRKVLNIGVDPSLIDLPDNWPTI